MAETKVELMTAADFNRFFTLVLKDKAFQNELMTSGFDALEARGFTTRVPGPIRTQIMKQVAPGGLAKKKYNCGICGICGTCGLCGGANAGSASAALWASFFLAITAAVPPEP